MAFRKPQPRPVLAGPPPIHWPTMVCDCRSSRIKHIMVAPARARCIIWATLDYAVKSHADDADDTAVLGMWNELRRTTRKARSIGIDLRGAIEGWLDQGGHHAQGFALQDAMRRIEKVIPMRVGGCSCGCFNRHVRGVPAMLEKAVRALHHKRKMLAWVCQRAEHAPEHADLTMIVCRTLGLA